MNLKDRLNSLIVKYRFRAQKKLSQNFMLDEKVLEMLVSTAEINSKDTVLEIGAGTGFLTELLLEKAGKVIGVEKDKYLFELLETEIGKNSEKKFELIKGDFLKADLPEFNKIVSLPPYSISSDILAKLFELDFERGVFVFQKEFVEKILSEPGFPDYVATSVLAQYFFDAEYVGTISPNAFFPKPKSDSAILLLNKSKKKTKAKNEKLFIKFVKEIFRYKNKNVSNAVANAAKALNISKEKIQAIDKEKYFQTKIMALELDSIVELFNSIAF